MSRLGDSIKTARVSSGLSEKALGKKCGFAEKFIKEIESGARIVSDEQAQRILKVLGVKDPVSTELEVAAEKPMAPRPKPRPYVLPVQEEPPAEPNDQWLNALGGVLKRVPIVAEDSLVIDHVLTPVIGGKIEGGNPEKVIYFRCPDDSMRGYRVYAGDLLLTVPGAVPINDALMLIQKGGVRMVRKIMKQDGGKVLLQSYDREFVSESVPLKEITIVGHCVKLERRL